MADVEGKGIRRYSLLATVSTFAVLTVGCEGDLPLRMVQRDVDSMKSEVAVVARTGEGTRMFIEERLKKIEGRLEKSERVRATLEEKLVKIDADLKSQSARVAQERQGFLQSQASLTVKLDELTTGVRLAQGQTEEIGHGVTELNRRVDEFGRQLDQLGRRLNGFDKQVSQSVVAAQEATTSSQQTTQQVTAALQQMAQQTNAAIDQVNTTAQLALVEARKTAKGKPITGPVSPPRVETQPLSPTVAPLRTSPPAPPKPAAQTQAQGDVPSSPTAPVAKPMARTESADEVYRNALNDYAKGNYELAIKGFRSHIELYPDSSLVPNARYWLGESYYSQKNYDQAIQEFAFFVKQHPENAKVASAMLKQGFASLDMGDKIRARTVLDKLIKQFPKSQEARWAKERLSQVK
ncbi:tol-pal system protein YbgF [Candidatus Methylomirabilis sp.]|uniref:Tol-pal system protein YbgF n=1 Tax=Candidatus Methylomirabilis tolerans TaxID=3123416 RepID=A0AAJ1EIA9_9BACT|nr:tol-pal system protein YbgF [Candidatus Methylomirabilis sp.]